MTEAEQERAAVVAWLRANSDVLLGIATDLRASPTSALRASAEVWESAADAIERGDHLGGDT